MKPERIAVLLVLATAFGVVGCKRIIEEAVKARNAQLDAGGPQAKLDEDQALGEKLNGYIRDCLNRYSKSVRYSEERYLDWVDSKKGPTGKENLISYGVPDISDPDACKTAVAKANAAPPSKPDIEKLALAYSSALAAVAPLVNEAHKYYERKDYIADKVQKGKQLHPKLVSAFEGFDKADNEFSKLVDQVQEDLDRRELVQIEKDEGKKAHWFTVNTTLLAKALLRESAKEVPKINLPALTAAEGAFQQGVDAFDAWAAQNKAEASNTSSYLSQARDLVIKGKNLMRRLREKKGFSAAERQTMGTSTGFTVEGSPDAVLDQYNRLVDEYNRVRF